MSARSSIATRALACLVAVLVLGSGTVGVATAATGGSTWETTSDPLGERTGTTTVVLETVVVGTTDALENTTDETTTELENATNETTDTVDGTVNETIDTIENTTDETTTELENTTDETTTELENTTDETTTELENTTDETNALLENVTERVTAPIEVRGGVGVEGDGSNVTVGTELGVAAASNDDGAAEEDSSGDDDGEGTGPAPSGSGSSGVDAVLVGLLGAITASGAAAGSTGASAGAGASGASAGGAAAGSAAGLVGGWLSQFGQLPGLRHLRRAGSTLPWELLPIFRYSRYDDSDPLENDRRRAVYETIAADPGCYLSQVSDRSDVALSTVRHHVRVLEEEGLVTSAKLNGKRRYYLDADGNRPGEGTDVADAELHAALAEPAKRGVLETLAELGSAPNGRLADELERDPSTVSHHLSALEDDELVVREKDGRAMVNELAPDVEATLRDEGTPSEEESAEPPMSAPADD
ncbi:winged helix-turn-helix transcriptional regulator [Haloterrigena alkaliphila]|uniref:Helix-turn-helix domain-containing protein n=1 Tax=Haloterrigena alkaliphila TaxID=2816475 RepID=A0A8A2VG36_9EURY|nr:helix-turn-helix domain-containing protein [Haloterrigena alkaliphila]QSW99312.1 helix-turn-helix domain-containing protein [Haloterrigena alkaliphila]